MSLTALPNTARVLDAAARVLLSGSSFTDSMGVSWHAPEPKPTVKFHLPRRSHKKWIVSHLTAEARKAVEAGTDTAPAAVTRSWGANKAVETVSFPPQYIRRSTFTTANSLFHAAARPLGWILTDTAGGAQSMRLEPLWLTLDPEQSVGIVVGDIFVYEVKLKL
jgi:hypothetical protein